MTGTLGEGAGAGGGGTCGIDVGRVGVLVTSWVGNMGMCAN